MGLQSFIAHGDKGALLYETDIGPKLGLPRPWMVKVYDIDEPNFVGAVYEDKARVAAPRSWFPKARSAIRPILPKRPITGAVQARPILPRR